MDNLILAPMEFWDGPLHIIRGLHVLIKEKKALKINFVSANSADPDVILQNVAFRLGLFCLPNYTFRVFWSTKG